MQQGREQSRQAMLGDCLPACLPTCTSGFWCGLRLQQDHLFCCHACELLISLPPRALPSMCPHCPPPSPPPHLPSQSCAWSGGVWDDRDIVSWSTAGGRCISADEAHKILQDEPDTEEVTITASSDGKVEGVQLKEWVGGQCSCRQHVCCGYAWGGQDGGRAASLPALPTRA